MQAQLDEKEEEIKVLKKKVKHQASLLKEGSELVLQKDLKQANDKILTLEGRFVAVVEGKKALDATMVPEASVGRILPGKLRKHSLLLFNQSTSFKRLQKSAE